MNQRFVSILTQSLGWVQRAVRHPSFQSSPNLLVECRGLCAIPRFNPRPTSRLGAVGVPASLFQSSPNLSVGCIWAMEVFQLLRSILGFNPHPNLSVGCSATLVVESLGPVPVSILTQPLGWVQSNCLAIIYDKPKLSFNPHPADRLGAVP